MVHTVCMISWRPVEKGKGSHMPNAVIDAALHRHPDGFGVAYREDGVLKHERFGPAEASEFRAALKSVDLSGGEYVAHFRFATHGKPCAELAHPFAYTDPMAGEVLVFHNGVISIQTAKDGTESDTSVFVRDVLAALPSRWWKVPAFRYLVGEAIGWSKLVLMTAEETVCLQEADGTWDGGLWYSSNHRPTVVSTWVPGAKPWAAPKGNGLSSDTPGKYASPATLAAERKPTHAQTRAARKAAKGWRARQATTVDSSAKGATSQPLALVTTEAAYRPDTVAYSSPALRHHGHPLTAVRQIDFDADGDHPDSVICDTCYTMGDLYVIDGTYYVDMSHRDGAAEDDPREEEAEVYGWG